MMSMIARESFSKSIEKSRGWSSDKNASRENFEDIKHLATTKFNFPRQGRKPHRALSDFFRHDRDDAQTGKTRFRGKS